ncbi:hypothetical protein C0992_011372 [Termitomyces sp. T32_za158]|nr:hypothetical protein C0992_011372 [Termitomyces sp. T32_za158]
MSESSNVAMKNFNFKLDNKRTDNTLIKFLKILDTPTLDVINTKNLDKQNLNTTFPNAKITLTTINRRPLATTWMIAGSTTRYSIDDASTQITVKIVTSLKVTTNTHASRISIANAIQSIIKFVRLTTKKCLCEESPITRDHDAKSAENPSDGEEQSVAQNQNEIEALGQESDMDIWGPEGSDSENGTDDKLAEEEQPSKTTNKPSRLFKRRR